LSFAQVQVARQTRLYQCAEQFSATLGVCSSYVHSLGATPKMESTVRVIHDHFRPIGRSLNDALTQSNLSFQSVDDAIRLMSPNCNMVKVDIEAAYCHVPIDLYVWDKTAFCWPTDSVEDLYFHAYLEFGLKNACEVFNRIGRAIIWMMARRGFHVLVACMLTTSLLSAPPKLWLGMFFWHFASCFVAL
jgi:hypothetical protein